MLATVTSPAPPLPLPLTGVTAGSGRAAIEHRLRTSAGTGHGDDACWRIRLWAEGSLITRQVWLDQCEWAPNGGGQDPERVIWPTWPEIEAGQAVSAGSPLAGVRDHWGDAGARLRDSAKWMAAVLGTALAAVIGTSPLSGLQQHRPPAIAIAVGAAGLVLLGCTLLLVVQVMRPRSISLTEVQICDERRCRLRANPLRRWKEILESQQDLYLPCGISCLAGLRQAMIIEEMTLVALARWINAARGDADVVAMLSRASSARAARLQELRDAAAQVATIGEYYWLRYRSAWATYCGGLCGLAGAAAVIAAFAWR